MDTKSHADTSTITSSADTTSIATSTTTASSNNTSANITNITANPATTSIPTPSRSKSPPPIPSTLSSKSGPVTSLSTDTVTVPANSNDGTDAKGQLTRAGSMSVGEELRGGTVEEAQQEGQMWAKNTQSPEESTAAVTMTSHDTQETTQQENPTYTGSWWDYVGWGSSLPATTRNESVPASGATDGNVVEDAVEGVKQDDSATELNHTVPSTEPSNAAISSDTTPSPPATAPVQSHASQTEPSPPEAEISSTTGMKSAPPTVLAEDPKPPPRAESVFSGETVRSGAGSWLAPWTWYGGSGTSAPPTAAASSISVDVDKGSKLKRQMTESEKVKEEALARDRGREDEAGAEAEAEKSGETEQQPGLEQEEMKDVGPSEAHATSSLPPTEQSASSPPTTAEESANVSLTSTPPTSSGWASFFSIGKGKGTSVKQIPDGSNDSQVKRDENGMEIMDLDEDEASVGDAQAGAISESKIDTPSEAIPIQSKEVVKKESMKEILKAGATSPERKVSLVKALLQPSSSPKTASILSSLSSSPSKHPIPSLPTKAPATSDQDNIPSANVSKDQIDISSRGRTDSMITTATSTSNASSVAKRAPLLVVSDDVKAKAATKTARSSSRGKEKDGNASGSEISDGKEKKEKSEKTKTKVEKKDSTKENDKDKKKDDKDKKHSKSNSGSSTPVPPAPPNLVLPTWADTFYTPPRSHLPSGVLPLTPLPGTEAYEAMHVKDEQKGLGSTLGRTMKYVSGVLFSGDRSNGEKRKTSSRFGNASASGSNTTSRRGSESSMPISGAGRRGSAASASSLPMSGGLVSPRIAALRAGSSSGRVGGSMRVGSAQAQTSKVREDLEIELMKEKERLYWDWGRSLPRSWEVVQFGQPIGLEQDDTNGVLEAGEDLKPEKAKAEEIDRDVSQSGQASSQLQDLIPGMGLEPGTTLSLPAHVLTNYKNKGKGREQALPEASAVEDVLKGCKKVVVIGIHGWFPGAVMRSVFGEPTGTSPKFVNMMVQALEVFQEKHGVRLEKITKIPLEGEGTIDRRVEKLYTNLVSNQEWMDDLHNADVIFVATHSQGSVVSTHLLDRLIRERHIRTSKNGTTEPITDLGINMVPLPPQRVCCLALCGIHLGPLRYLSTSSLVQPYIQYFESAAARELFEFQNTENEVSKSYVKALRNVVDNGTKMVYVASLNDQVVPIYSGLFTAASHPLILRALYIDGDAYNSSDFLSNLLVLLLRVLNTGLSDSGLLAHLSEVTAGSLNGVGHSTAYEELATYSLAVDYLFLANDGFDEHPELTFEPFNAASEMNDYEIPWALRDLIADERVAHFFSREITDLRDAFRDWNPKTSILRDIKRKLQPIQRLPSTLAPGSANSTSKL